MSWKGKDDTEHSWSWNMRKKGKESSKNLTRNSFDAFVSKCFYVLHLMNVCVLDTDIQLLLNNVTSEPYHFEAMLLMLHLSHATSQPCTLWVMLHQSHATSEPCTYWVMLYLSHATTVPCTYWVMLQLSHATSEPWTYWVMLHLSHATSEPCTLWVMLHLSHATTEPCT